MTTMSDLQFFTDRSLVQTLPAELISAMTHQGLIAPDHQRIRFCGLFSWPKGSALFLPMNSDEKENQSLAAHYLLKALDRYYLENPTAIYNDDGDDLINADLLSLAIHLFEDYITHGLYVQRYRKKSVNTGKVNWARTVARQTPFPVSDHHATPVYLELESSRSTYASDCEIAKIHAAVIRDIYKKFGVLIAGEQSEDDTHLTTFPQPTTDQQTQLALLTLELSKTYSERDITLLKWLHRYLEKTWGKEQGALVIGTRHFHNVWEAMLDTTLDGIKQFNQRLPVPYYYQNGHFIEAAEKGQRTDTVIRTADKSHYAVVDAKYYAAQTPQSAPGWPDIVKQLYYQKAVSSVVGEDKQVTTHFVFPGTAQRLVSTHVGNRGQNKQTQLVALPEYPAIHCHYCPSSDLIKAYVQGRKLQTLRTEILSKESD
ncbi:LlaJI restriction endonuclease [Salinivibrio sp. ES.052]|nr:LlaJI restriction endonuclease [Salinivibrio sp. ES.052]